MDIEVVDDGKPDNNRELVEAMSSVKDVLVAQLESLKSIARWQDQTALYTSHLQNIKTDMNQVRKWGPHIENIAQRVDVIATKLTQDATPQSGDDKPSEDATTLLPTLGMIEANTRLTYEAIQVLADATRESREDKREVQEKVVPEKKQVKDKKAETGVKKHMSDAMTGVRDFFSKIISWFAMASLFIAPLMIGPDKLFGALKEFFGHLKTFFTAITKFFMQNVVPAISFLMEKLISFFNEISGPLGRLGTEIGHALKLIGPKLWNAVSPVLDAVGVGLVKAIDFFTVVVGKIGPALDVIGQFVSDIFSKFGGANDVVTGTFDSIGEFFENIMLKMKATNVEDMMDNLRISLQTFFNLTLDTMASLVRMMLEFYQTVNGLTAAEMEPLIQQFYKPLTDAKFEIDRSSQKSSMIDFHQSDADIDKQIDRHVASGDIEPHEATTMKDNKAHFRQRQDARSDHSLARIQSLNFEKDIKMGGFGAGMDVGLYELKGLKGAIPGIEHDVIVVRGASDGSGGIDSIGYWTGPGAKDRAIGIGPDGTYSEVVPDVPMGFGSAMHGLIENMIKRGVKPAGRRIIGKEREPFDMDNTLADMSVVELHSQIGQEVSALSTATPPPASGTGGQNNAFVNNKGPTTTSAFSIHRSGDPTVEFGRDYK